VRGVSGGVDRVVVGVHEPLHLPVAEVVRPLPPRRCEGGTPYRVLVNVDEDMTVEHPVTVAR